MAEMNGLTQGSLTSDEYIKKAKVLYVTLGEEHAFTLATKFVEGINNRAVQVQVDYAPFYRGHPGVHLQYCYYPAFRINHEGNERQDHPSKHP